MKVIEAPQASPELYPDQTTLFLAGGITGCPDWQASVIKLLVGPMAGVNIDYIYNPRRKNFPIDDPKAMEEQVRWEHKHLSKATAIAFWFPDCSVQPIALFEYGKWLGPGKPRVELVGAELRIRQSFKQLFVGVHPSYHRKDDVYLQTKLESPSQKIVASLSELVADLKQWGRCCISESIVEAVQEKKKEKKKKKKKSKSKKLS